MPSAQKLSRSWCVALMAVALTGMSAHPAFAAEDAPSDEATSEARRNEAKAKYQAGVEAYEKRRYKDAVDLFLAADKLSPSAPLSFNIGRAYERLGDDTSALRWYRDYLRRSANAPNASAVREVVAKLSLTLSKKGVQQVTVLSLPAGATVNVDEQPMGVTPWTGELAPGTHHLLLSARGYRDVERDFELPATEAIDVSLRLEAAATVAPPAPPASALSASDAAPPRIQTSLPVASPAPGRDSARGFGPWPWITAGVGVAALGGALGFELWRRSAEEDAKHESVQVKFQSDVDAMESRKTTSRILLGLGGAALITGAVLIVVSRTHRAAPAEVSFLCAPAGCALRAGGRF